MKRSLVLFTLSACASHAALADTAALQRCRDLRDAAARLACYDAIPLGSSAAPAPAANNSSAAPAAAAVPPAAAFGLESRPAPAAGPAPLASIESAIDGPFDGWLPRSQFRLANGQVWEVTDGSTAAYRLTSPKVQISRGVSGSFFIAIEGVSQTPRVRRVK